LLNPCPERLENPKTCCQTTSPGYRNPGGISRFSEGSRQTGMTKEDLIERAKGLLRADDDLSFLMKLEVEELKILVARIRERVDLVEK